MTPGGVLRSPLLHFLLLGAVLYALSPLLPQSSGSAWDLQTIKVSDAEQQRLHKTWRAETGRNPSAAEMQAELQRLVDDEILLREALKLGLHASDPVARQRMIANLRFAYPESKDSDAALLEQALALNMQESDLVVRRRLIQLMQMRIVSHANLSEAELRDYVARHPERYAKPVRFAFRQVFFSTDRAPQEAARRAEQALKRLQSGEATPALGDSFLLGTEFSLRSQDEIGRQFGPDFARALARLEPGVWSGPLQSPFGIHLVKIEQVEASAEADFEQVSRRAAYAMLTEREQQVLREELGRLRLDYRVELPPAPAALGSATEVGT